MVLLVKQTVLFGGNLELQERRSSYCNDTPCSEAPKKYIHHFHQFSVRQIFEPLTLFMTIYYPHIYYCCLDPCAVFLPNIAKLQGLDHPENVADFLSWLLLEATTTV